MDELLTPVRTTYLRQRNDEEPLLVEARPAAKFTQVSNVSKVRSADDALSVLKSQPDYESLIAVLQFLTGKHAADFNIHVPTPKSAAIIHVLVQEIVPNYWTILQEGPPIDNAGFSVPLTVDADRLVKSLQSMAGINAVVGHIKALIQESKLGKKDVKRPDLNLHLGLFLDLLSALLDGHKSIQTIWQSSTVALGDATSKKVQSQSLISLLTSGRVLSISAETSGIIGKEDTPIRARWLVDGVEFSKWIGRNIAAWAQSQPVDAELQACFDVFQRSLSLGYSGKAFSSNDEICLLTRPQKPWWPSSLRSFCYLRMHVQGCFQKFAFISRRCLKRCCIFFSSICLESF